MPHRLDSSDLQRRPRYVTIRYNTLSQYPCHHFSDSLSLPLFISFIFAAFRSREKSKRTMAGQSLLLSTRFSSIRSFHPPSIFQSPVCTISSNSSSLYQWEQYVVIPSEVSPMSLQPPSLRQNQRLKVPSHHLPNPATATGALVYFPCSDWLKSQTSI